MKTPLKFNQIMYKEPYKSIMDMLYTDYVFDSGMGLRCKAFIHLMDNHGKAKRKDSLVVAFLNRLKYMNLIYKEKYNKSFPKWFISKDGLELIALYSLEQELETRYENLRKPYIKE